MGIEATKAAATQLLNEYYKIHTTDLPTQRTKSQWKAENKRGFFLGIILNGEASHISKLHMVLSTNQLKNQRELSTKTQLADPQHPRTFIDDMFAFYILPFHKDYSESSCHTPLSLTPSSRSNSAEDLDHFTEDRELTHKNLKRAVEKRDGVCLFCWDTQSLELAHIIEQKNISIAYDEPSLMLRAGLKQIHQIQNGMLLCNKCHDQFDRLKRYVDVLDGKLVINAVNFSILPNDDKQKESEIAIGRLKNDRLFMERYFSDGRRAVETNGEMALYFILENPTQLPNREALKFHKTACLIWRMAGGAESDDECCPDDDGYVPMDYQIKSLGKWIDSSATLVVENIQ